MARAEDPRTTTRWDLDVYVALVTAAGGRGKVGAWVKATVRARLVAEGFLRPGLPERLRMDAAAPVGRVPAAEPAPPAGEASAVDPRPAAGAAAPRRKSTGASDGAVAVESPAGAGETVEEQRQRKALLYVVAGKVGGQSLALRALRMGEVRVDGAVCKDPNAMVDPSAVAV